MRTRAVGPGDLLTSIIALPPIARTADGIVAKPENRKIVDWLTAGGVSTLMYGGVANIPHIAPSEYAGMLDVIEDITPADTLVIPAIGPDFGKASDQAALLRGRDFPTAILMPFSPVSPWGVAKALRRLSDACGRPLMSYIKSADYLSPSEISALLRDGVLWAVEYNGDARFLAELLDLLGDASRVVDGAGERSVVASVRLGVKGYTSGSGILAPYLSMALLDALKAGDVDKASVLREYFIPFERLRATYGVVPVLHDGVRLAGIADTGPLGPFWASFPDDPILSTIKDAAMALKDASLAYQKQMVATA